MASTSQPAQSGPLSVADALLLNRYGHDTMRDVVGIISESVFCSAYGIFFALAMYSICQKGFKSRRAITLSLVVVYLYAASVTQWAMDSYIALKNIYCLYMTTDVPLPDRAELGDEIFAKFAGAQETIFDINMIVADAVVIWRTWAVYQGRISAIMMPCVLLFTAFVFALMDIICNFAEGQLAETICPLPSGILVWGFSVGTNIVCTLSIGWKAWQHRKMMKEWKGVKYHGMSTENILSLLVESGFIYSILWIIQVIGYLYFPPYSPAYYFLPVLIGLGHQMTGMYPTIIIVIVNFQRTIWEEYPITLGDHIVPNSLQWVVNSNRSGATRTSDDSPEVGIHLDTVRVGKVMRGDLGMVKQPPAEEI